jgi:MFS family permease
MDTLGRVRLLCWSSLGVSASLLVLAASFAFSSISVLFAVLGLCGFMAAFSLGWGPLSGVILAEVFPLRIR